MSERKVRKPKPIHPFPYVAGCRPLPEGQAHIEQRELTRAQMSILSHLKHGARILFDIEQKRALLYSFRRGVEHLAELTVRSLASLIRAGKIMMAGREGRLIHYCLA